jgi:hypothetical protein
MVWCSFPHRLSTGKDRGDLKPGTPSIDASASIPTPTSIEVSKPKVSLSSASVSQGVTVASTSMSSTSLSETISASMPMLKLTPTEISMLSEVAHLTVWLLVLAVSTSMLEATAISLT